MRSLLALLIATTATIAQTIAIKPLDPINISAGQAATITSRVRETSVDYALTVDRGNALQNILEEHGLRQAGALNILDDSLGLTSADRYISGYAGSSGTTAWYLDLTLTDVETGQVINAQHANTSSYKDLLIIAAPLTKALIQGTRIDDDERVISQPDSQRIIIGTEKQIIETHIYNHQSGKPGMKPRFVPCSYCSGSGEIPCRGHEICPSGYRDCPYCTSGQTYQGPETHGQALTGHWLK